MDSVEVNVAQSVGDIPDGADVIGARVERLRASPFHQAAFRISQTAERVASKLIGLSVGEWITNPRLLAVDDLQEMGLFEPAGTYRPSLRPAKHYDPARLATWCYEVATQ